MDAQEARQILTDSNEEDESPADLPAPVLPKLTHR